MAAEGRESKNEILRVVSALGLRTKNGKRVSSQTFNALLRKPVYVGRIRTHKWGEEHVGDWQPLVSDETFRRVQHLHFRKALTKKYKEHPEFPLRRFFRCANCDGPLTGSSSKGRERRYAYYHCPKCKGSALVRSSKDHLESEFLALLERLQPSPGYLNLFRAIVADVWKSERENVRGLRKAVEQRIQNLRDRSEQLDRVFIFDKAIDRTTYVYQRDQLRAELTVAELELGDARFDELEVDGVLAFAEHVFGNLPALWKNAEPNDRRRIQDAMFPSGLVWDGERIGTAITIPAFSWLQAVSAGGSTLASPTGFEPVF